MTAELNIQPCFILAMGRSGTTLLTNILNQHQQIVAAPENNFILFGKQLHGKTGTYLNKEFPKIFKANHNHTYSIWEPKEAYIKGLPNQYDYAGYCKNIYFKWSEEQGKKAKLFVDKNPIYSLYVSDLMKIFPKAKFIVLIRDYRDNIASRSKYTKGVISQWMVSYASSWKMYYKSISKAQKKRPEQFFTLKYEDLVDQPEDQIKDLCQFLQVEYTEAMTKPQSDQLLNQMINSTINESGKEQVQEMHGQLRKPINKEKVNYWSSVFTENEIKLQEFVCGSFAEKWGYQTTCRVSALERLKMTIQLMALYPFFWASIKIYFGIFYDIPWWLKKKIFKF